MPARHGGGGIVDDHGGSLPGMTDAAGAGAGAYYAEEGEEDEE